MLFRHLAAAALVTLAACSLDSAGFGATGRIHIVNGAKDAGALQVFVDGQFVGDVPFGTVGTASQIGGAHTIVVLRGNGSAGFSRGVSVADDETVTIVAFDSSGILTPAFLSDTNAVVPATASKLRVAHFASNAGPIDIWRTQPDFATPIRVMFPFTYQNTSPYLQSNPGDWMVLVSDTVPQATPGAPMPDTLAASSVITVPAGLSVTVVVVDKLPSGVQFVTVAP